MCRWRIKDDESANRKKTISRKGAKAQRKTQRFLLPFAGFFAPLRRCARLFHKLTVQFAKPQTLTQLTVTSMLTSAFQNHCATLKRGLGLLLVLFIFYGTVVEAAHRHGRKISQASHPVSLAQTGSNSSTLNTTPGCNDCLICQLHQSFSASLISIRLNAEPSSRSTLFRASDSIPIRSAVNSPRSDRAPPQAN